MCRYDDDFAWMLDHEDPAHVADDPTHCADCGRIIPAGEPFAMLYGLADGGDADERLWGYFAYAKDPVTGKHYRFLIAADADEEGSDDTADMFKALGYMVSDDKVGEPEWVNEPWCLHCRAGNQWLVAVCDQHHLCVAAEDLVEHTGDYTPAQLGPDFMTLATLAEQRWRSKLTGNLIPVSVIERLTTNAIDHARVVGLHP